MSINTKTIKISSLDNIDKAAKEFINGIGENKIIAFNGVMGAGKTTFIKSICKVLKVEDTVNSPTFSIVNEYSTVENNTIYHFDFYRIENVQEAFDFGVEDYFFSNNLCLIEWPENISEILPDNTLFVSITENEDFERIISFL